MNKKETNPIRVELLKRLRKIYDDKDFCLGVYAHLKNDNHVNQMISWLDKHKDEEISSSEILLKSMEIRYEKRLEANGVTTRD